MIVMTLKFPLLANKHVTQVDASIQLATKQPKSAAHETALRVMESKKSSWPIDFALRGIVELD